VPWSELSSYEESLENSALAIAAHGAYGHGGSAGQTGFAGIIGEMDAKLIGQWLALPFSGQAIKNFEVAHRSLAASPGTFPL
jgi:hypothetical protein